MAEHRYFAQLSLVAEHHALRRGLESLVGIATNCFFRGAVVVCNVPMIHSPTEDLELALVLLLTGWL